MTEDPKGQRMMNTIAAALEEAFNPDGNKKVCFVLLAADFHGGDDECSFISNGQREGVIALLKGMIATLEMREAMGTA